MAEKITFSPELITNNLKTKFVGQRVIYYPSVTSTMEVARAEALWDAPAGTVIVADQQTTGRGRLHRPWTTSPESLAFSTIFRPNIEFLPLMTMMAALAVTYTIKNVTGIKAQIKWPNDVLVRDKKVCGILIENDIRKKALKSCIIGIGLNINMKLKDYPQISSIATSLSDENKKELSRLEILRQILIEMDTLYDQLGDDDSIFLQWKNNLVTLGQVIKVNVGDEIYTGTAESVTREGTLMLRQKDGHLVKIVTGDVGM